MSDEIINIGNTWLKKSEYDAMKRFQRMKEKWMHIFWHLPPSEKERISKLKQERQQSRYEEYRFKYAYIYYGKTKRLVWCDNLTGKIYKADSYAKTLIEIKSGRFRFVKFLSPMEL
jgi:hypothetical protein